jgi:hypothetical protein
MKLQYLLLNQLRETKHGAAKWPDDSTFNARLRHYSNGQTSAQAYVNACLHKFTFRLWVRESYGSLKRQSHEIFDLNFFS